MIFHAFFQEKDFFKVQVAANEAGVSDADWTKFLAYVAAVYNNMGAYHSFGHNKFVPEISPETFKTILLSNPLYSDEEAFYK